METRYKRILEDTLKNHFKKYNQAIVLLGARQTGKTTLLKRIFPNALYLLVDDQKVYETLSTYSAAVYKSLVSGYSTVIIDEAQKLSDPGRAVKIMYDLIPGLRIIVSGSSSFQIKNRTAESLAGRAFYFNLFPLTFSEYLYQLGIEDKIKNNFVENILSGNFAKKFHAYSVKELLETNILPYGLYPYLVDHPGDSFYLTNLAEILALKDIVDLGLVAEREVAFNLLKLLAFQVGNIINYSEIARTLGISILTVRKYIRLFEEAFIVFRLYPLTSRKRNELKKSPKIYFWDTGLRNGLLRSFDTGHRPDIGQLFENFIIAEIKKYINYYNLSWDLNFWRLKSGGEIDLVITEWPERKYIGIEIKVTKSRSSSKKFKEYYKGANVYTLNMENWW